MTHYTAPVSDIAFTLNKVAGLEEAIGQGMFPELTPDLVAAVLEEAGRFAADRLAPLNRLGDTEGARLEGDRVILPEGWAEAYRQWAEAGWASLPCPAEYGGQHLPTMISIAAHEMWNAACMAFALCPVLSHGAVEAIAAHATDALKDKYLPKLVSGEWTATMNLTEPQAGSDLNLLRSRAVPQADGSYRITGTKIFITYGEHEMAENIIHLVLARLPDAPPGTRGISLFLVPKYLVGDDGSRGGRNDLKCTGLEHKLGIHASPTCVMSFGEGEGAIGWLVGEENRGLNCMFTMMNNARLATGIQGVSIGERATQAALAYAAERIQGRAPNATDGASPIIAHPDVRRMLMSMRALTAAGRAICYVTAAAIDAARFGSDEEQRARGQLRANLLTPVAKAFTTGIGVDVASLGVQVHGGMGFIEETGAAQYYRDARIAPIYEGTNGIQAIDLVTRKLPVQGGEVVRAYIAGLLETAEKVMAANRADFGRMGYRLNEAVGALEEATGWMLQTLQGESAHALAVAAPYLRLFGLTTGGCYLAQGALAAASEEGSEEMAARIAVARYYAENHLPEVAALKMIVMQGGSSVLDAAAPALGA